MASTFFVTGTDTGVGKTWVSCALIHAFKARGLSVAGMKPVASGGELTPQGWRNEDALALQRAANVTADYHIVNPYCFQPPVAPHLAARQAGVSIQLSVLQQAYRQLTGRADIVVVEGAGGWRVPLEPSGYLSDFPEAQGMQIVLVVGLRLGCLNHAVLTAEAIRSGPCKLVGWIGNSIDPAFALLTENLQTLTERLPVPCLGVLPHAAQPDVPALSALLSLDRLLP